MISTRFLQYSYNTRSQDAGARRPQDDRRARHALPRAAVRTIRTIYTSAAEVRDRLRAAHGAFYTTRSLPVVVYNNLDRKGLQFRCTVAVSKAPVQTLSRRSAACSPRRALRETGKGLVQRSRVFTVWALRSRACICALIDQACMATIICLSVRCHGRSSCEASISAFTLKMSKSNRLMPSRQRTEEHESTSGASHALTPDAVRHSGGLAMSEFTMQRRSLPDSHRFRSLVPHKTMLTPGCAYVWALASAAPRRGCSARYGRASSLPSTCCTGTTHGDRRQRDAFRAASVFP